MENILNIYKPKGWTSFDVVAKIRKIYGVKKVGHAGTLDPLATGVLVVAVGREATKKISEIVGKEKEYIAKIRFGTTSTTDDAEGEKTETKNIRKVAKKEIENILKKFIGGISQVPPIYSAIKIGGKRSYELARKGKDVKLKARQAFIRDIEILSYRWPYLKINVTCGPGTYIRSLARDIGKELGCGAYLAELERTRVGEYGLKEAVKIEDVSKKF